MNKFFVLLVVSLAVLAAVMATPFPRPAPLPYPYPAPAEPAAKETLKGSEALYYTSYGAVPYVAGVYPAAYPYYG